MQILWVHVSTVFSCFFLYKYVVAMISLTESDVVS